MNYNWIVSLGSRKSEALQKLMLKCCWQYFSACIIERMLLVVLEQVWGLFTLGVALGGKLGVSAKGSHRSCLGHCYVPHTSENHVFTKKACFSWLGIVSSFEQKVFHFQQMCLILFLLSWEDAEECGLTMGEWRMIWWINSQLPGSYIFLCLLLWHIANDTEKKKKKSFL